MAMAPSRLLLPVQLAMEPASSPAPHVAFHPSRHSLSTRSRSVVARIVEVQNDQEQQQNHFDRGREMQSSADGRDSGPRLGRVGGRSSEGGGYRNARNSTPWKSRTNYGQVQQIGMGREVDNGAAEAQFPAEQARFSSPGRRQQWVASQQVAGKPTSVENAIPPFKRNDRPPPRQHLWRQGRPRGFHANGDAGSNIQEEKSAMARIVEKLRRMQEEGLASEHFRQEPRPSGRTAGALILPKPNQDLFSMTKNWSTSELAITEPGEGVLDAKFPWEKDEEAKEEEDVKEVRVKPPSLAELTIPGPELKRLRTLSLQLQQRLKIGRLGVTENIATSIKDRWRHCEVVKVKCEGPPAYNMKKTQEDLERKTGGLVIWRAGSVAVVYRGKDYGQSTVNREAVGSLERKLEGLISPYYEENIRARARLGKSNEAPIDKKGEDASSLNAEMQNPPGTTGLQAAAGPQIDTDYERLVKSNEAHIDQKEEDASVSNAEIQNPTGSKAASGPQIDTDYEREVEGILKDLGPRIEEWSGPGPHPVDADLLPATVPNFHPPYRLLPYGVKPNLSNAQLTNLRRLSRHLSPHFVLGRVKGLEGLVASIAKLWEKSEIVKIAVKRGVQNTNNERMAEEIKRLSGGVLLARDKQFITFYRGKDFLPQQVAVALQEREAMVRALQEQEESSRADRSIAVQQDTGIEPSVAATALKEASPVEPSWVQWMDIHEQTRLKREAVKARRLEIVCRIERRLDMALKKKEKAVKELEKVEEFLKPIDRPADMETITEEERFMFRKLGLSMKAFLLVGRRGIFDGVVENMHLHWKHRELVKIMVKEKDPVRLQETARLLECESRGILVAVETTSKGQAIIVYRGKNYRRPTKLRPPNLLTKRKALKRSIEIQRREALSRHIQNLEQEIVKMRAGLSKFERSKPDEMESNEPNDLQEDSDDDYGSLPSEDQKVDGQLQNQQGEAPSMTGDNTHTISILGCRDTTKLQLDREKLKRLSRLGPIYIAEPLMEKQVLKLQKEARSLSKTSHFLVGKSDVLTGLAKAIRIYFLDHALVKIGVKGRAPGTSIQDLVHQLEDLTGGVLISQTPGNILMYRGWPDGEELPISEIYDVLSPEMLEALEVEGDDGQDDVVDEDYTVGNQSNASDDENDEDHIGATYSDEGDFLNDDTEADHEDEDSVVQIYSDFGNVAQDEAGEDDEDRVLLQET